MSQTTSNVSIHVITTNCDRVKKAWSGGEETGDDQTGASNASQGPLGHWIALMTEHMAAQTNDKTTHPFLWPKLFTGRSYIIFWLLGDFVIVRILDI